MKRIYHFFIGLLAVGLTACSSDENEPTPTDKYELNFQVLNYEQIDLNSPSRAATTPAAPNIAMAIYDAQTNKPVESPTIHASGSANAGAFSAKLPKGDYNIVFLAYHATKALVAENPTAITWDAQVVTDTYLKKISLSVDESTQSQQEILLSRAVGRFTLQSKGTAVPQNFDHFRIQMTGGSYQLNALTGLAGADASRDYAFNSQKEAAGKASITQPCYAFLPQEECKVDITLIAEDADNKEIRKRIFTQVPMKVNRDTRYTGDFFNESSSNDFSVKLEEKEWDTVDVEF